MSIMARCLICIAIGLYLVPAQAAPPLQLVKEITGENLMDGKAVTVSAEKGLGTVVVFLSALCPCSDSHNQELVALSKEYPEVQFLGVHSNLYESSDIAKPYFTRAAFSFPIIQDSQLKLANQFKALKTPHVFVISKRGEIVYRGGVSSSQDFNRADRKYLREALLDLKQNKPIHTPEGRTLGCAISRGTM
jgi:hypothetical protein